jgi:hypothetical protein
MTGFHRFFSFLHYEGVQPIDAKREQESVLLSLRKLNESEKNKTLIFYQISSTESTLKKNF